jgi:hypothetical protein
VRETGRGGAPSVLAEWLHRLDVEGVTYDVVTVERGRVEDLPARGL